MKVDALCAIAATQVDAGDTAGARVTFRRAIATTARITGLAEPLRGWALNRVAVVQAKAGLLTDATGTAARIIDASPRAGALTHIAAAQAQRGDLAGAKRSFSRAEATAGTVEPGVSKFLSLLEIANVLVRIDDVAEAERILGAAKAAAAELLNPPVEDGYLVTIAERQAQMGDAAEAEATAASITEARNRVQALCAIVAARMKAKEMAAAKVLIEQAEAATAGIGEASDKAMALGQIAAAWATFGDLAKTAATISTIVDPTLKASSLMNIAGVAAKAGDLAGAKRFVAEAKAAAMGGPGTPNPGTLSWIGEGQVWMGDLLEARATASEVSELPLDPRGNDRIEMILGLDRLAVAQARAGDLVGAKATVALIESDYGGDKGMRAIGSAQVWQEGIAAAEDWASRLNKPLESCYARLGIAEAASALARGMARPKTSVWEDP